jgi:kynurenine formamidase
MKVIDLSHYIEPNMPAYPGTEPPTLKPANTYEKDGFKETRLSMFTHTGTHMDPPAHLFAGRTTLDQFPPEQFMGKALVIDCRDLKEGGIITMEHIRRYEDKADKADFLLFSTGWEQYWGQDAYFGSYPCMDEEVLDYIIAGNYKGIGVDTISIDPMNSLTRHRKLFRDKDIVIIENLTNLHLCGNSLISFSAFPLKIADCDGSPVRAAAWFD